MIHWIFTRGSYYVSGPEEMGRVWLHELDIPALNILKAKFKFELSSHSVYMILTTTR